MKISHIVWTTVSSWPPHDKRGAWQAMADFYKTLDDDFQVSFSKPLLDTYTSSAQKDQLLLSKIDRETVSESLLELVNNDRIAEGLQILAIAITANEVHLLIEGTLDETKQKLARLKSRSATLLGMSDSSRVGQPTKNTWSKGLWAAEFDDNEEIFEIKSFIKQQNA